ncbi:menaquinone biosynthesis protein [bacterium]|jgi:chorismate dehydratase|nr:menaquinone biosynthesis protein [bacterium]
MKSSRWRVGAVSYLNTKPLIRHLTDLAPAIDLILEVPSRLASDLSAGKLDVGLIPSIEFFRGQNYTILPGASISSFGPVMSVKLCSRVPFGKIQSVALDEGSRTSIALMTILLRHLFQVRPETVPFPLRQGAKEMTTDACLIIGDRAMKVPDGEYPFTLDLGYEWSRWTGLPFVFAFWSVRSGVELPESVMEAFVQAKEAGRREIGAIVAIESQRLGIDEARCRHYLENVIRHDFGPPELAGLEKFYELAREEGLAPEGVQCVFHGSGNLAESR